MPEYSEDLVDIFACWAKIVLLFSVRLEGTRRRCERGLTFGSRVVHFVLNGFDGDSGREDRLPENFRGSLIGDRDECE